MKILKPFAISTRKKEETNYFSYRQQMRFLNILGIGIQRIADQHAQKIIDANREIGQEINTTLKSGFTGVQRRQEKIHDALIDQTEVMRMGFEGVEIRLEDGFDQLSGGLNEVAGRVDHVGEVIVQEGERMFRGMAGLKASFDMGMANIVSQFELQRKEIEAGFEQLVDTLKNQRKIEARERFLDGKNHYEQYLRHPEESQFLTDAYEYLGESVKLYKGHPFSHLYLGHIFQEPDRYYDPGRARDHYQLCATYAKGLENKKLSALGYFMAAWMSYVMREFEEAITLGLLSAEFDPREIPENYYNLAKYYACSRNAEKSLEYLDLAIKQFDPLYAIKAELDEDFHWIQDELNAYFIRIRDEAAQEWDNEIQKIGLPPPKFK